MRINRAAPSAAGESWTNTIWPPRTVSTIRTVYVASTAISSWPAKCTATIAMVRSTVEPIMSDCFIDQRLFARDAASACRSVSSCNVPTRARSFIWTASDVWSATSSCNPANVMRSCSRTPAPNSSVNYISRTPVSSFELQIAVQWIFGRFKTFECSDFVCGPRCPQWRALQRISVWTKNCFLNNLNKCFGQYWTLVYWGALLVYWPLLSVYWCVLSTGLLPLLCRILCKIHRPFTACIDPSHALLLVLLPLSQWWIMYIQHVLPLLELISSANLAESLVNSYIVRFVICLVRSADEVNGEPVVSWTSACSEGKSKSEKFGVRAGPIHHTLWHRESDTTTLCHGRRVKCASCCKEAITAVASVDSLPSPSLFTGVSHCATQSVL